MAVNHAKMVTRKRVNPINAPSVTEIVERLLSCRENVSGTSIINRNTAVSSGYGLPSKM
jgi:hypothetical protein